MTTALTSYNVSPNPNDGINGVLPVGSIVMWPTNVAPVDWLLCGGGEVQIADYPVLFSIVGATFGDPTSTSFFLPDTGARTIRGVGGGGYSLGATGGADSVSITADNLPAHTHPITDPGHTHSFTAMSEQNEGTSGAAFGRLGNNDGLITASATTGIIKTDANETAHTDLSIVNNFIVFQYIIKAR